MSTRVASRLLSVAIGVFLSVTIRAAAAQAPVRVGPIDASQRSLTGAVALGVVVAVDPKSGWAEFRISCGWYAKRAPASSTQAWLVRGKVKRGLWKVDLRGLDFTLSTAPGKASSYAYTVSLVGWERAAEHHGWSGSLSLVDGYKGLSSAGHTDICHGVLG